MNTWRAQARQVELLNDLFIDKNSAEEIKQEAINDGMTVLLQEGLHLVFAGRTDIKQVMATCIAT